jgi:hypothetical protein
MAKPKPDPQADAKAIKKLQETKAANKVERAIDRVDGRDTRKTRDGGTNRRNWR